MLKKFVSIENLGLLHDSGNSPTFKKTTLIFAENGRGKSTLCSLLRSLELNDTTELKKRQTVDRSGNPAAHIVFGTGANVSLLQNGVWDHPRPNIRVFDTAFVRANVHAGPGVQAENRRSLLQFALGDTAVEAALAEVAANGLARDIRERIRQHEAALSSRHVGITLDAFIALPTFTDIAGLLREVDAKIRATESAAAILRRSSPEEIALPTWDLSALFGLFSRDIETVSASAQALTQAHLTRIGLPNAEGWIREGQEFEKEALCPYCGQDIEHSDLLAAFRAIFTDEYRQLVADLDAADISYLAATSPQSLEAIQAGLQVQNARISAWADVLDLEPVTVSDEDVIAALSTLDLTIHPLIAAKRAAPLETTTVEDLAEARAKAEANWAAVRSIFDKVNEELRDRKTKIAEYRLSLTAADITELKAERAGLQRSESRHLADVTLVVDELLSERVQLRIAERAADEAREAVRALMNATLTQYQSKINSLLTAFGAEFQIEQMRANFRGEPPQSEYRLNLRNTSVPLQHDEGPDFDSALSDGDKRTLALAFFTASVLNDPNLSSQIVVIDDPMSSLDRNRREHTANLLCEMNDNSLQLIVSGHDSLFLRQVQQQVRRADSAAEIAEIALQRGAHGYSKWEPVSLEELCESEWLSKYRELETYIKDGTGSPRTVATHIRPVLEGYLHRRFPRHISEGLMLGQVLTLVQEATSPSPLVFASGSLDELRQINAYAGKFHHETNAGFATAPVVDQEVLTYARRTMDVIHGKP